VHALISIVVLKRCIASTRSALGPGLARGDATTVAKSESIHSQSHLRLGFGKVNGKFTTKYVQNSKRSHKMPTYRTANESAFLSRLPDSNLKDLNIFEQQLQDKCRLAIS